VEAVNTSKQIWELIIEAMVKVGGAQRWIYPRHLASAIRTAHPNLQINERSIRRQMFFHCPNHTYSKFSPTQQWKKNPLFESDALGRFRLLSHVPAMMKAIAEGRREQPETFRDEEISEKIEQFVLEEEMFSYMLTHLSELDLGGNLVVYKSLGVQYTTPVGVIDLLCEDKDTGDFVVVDLRREASDGAVVERILRYIGWVKKLLAKGKNVRGIVVASRIDNTLRYAVAAIPNIDVKLYEINFSLKDASLPKVK